MTRYHFFGGKGGVGKTTCAAAHALALSSGGQQVLALSTDPAHSLGDALEAALGPEPREVEPPPAWVAPRAGAAGAGRLLAAELAAAPAWRRWQERHRASFTRIAEEGSYLDREDVERLLALPLPGADELLALLEAVRLARDSGAEEVVVDTAPTAHTLRLLASPETLRRFASLLLALQEKRRQVAESLTGAWRPDESDRAIAELEADAEEALDLVRDPERTRLTWVLLPEALSVEETLDAVGELEESGIPVLRAVVNRLTPPPPEPCGECEARRAAEAEAVERLAAARPDLDLVGVPETWRGSGADAERQGAPGGEEGDLAAVARALAAARPPVEANGAPEAGGRSGAPEAGGAGEATATPQAASALAADAPATDPDALVALLAPPGLELLFLGGKGGVGKSTCAAATALLVARCQPERQVRLVSTDPAHSLADVLKPPGGAESPPTSPTPATPPTPRTPRTPRTPPPPPDLHADLPPNLEVREIDAGAALVRVRERLRGDLEDLFGSLGRRGGWQAAADREVVERFLDTPPPGLDELVAVAALAEPPEPEEASERSAAEPAAHSPRRVPDLVIVDTAPTGHALRLLGMPALALRWDHALMAILLKYRRTLGLGTAAEELLRLARDLRRLDRRLREGDRARFVVVTRAARLPHAETLRLLRSLGEMGIAVPAVVVNAVTRGSCSHCRRRADAEARWFEALVHDLRAGGPRGAGVGAILRTPARFPPPRGVADLEAWSRRWIVAPPAGSSAAPRSPAEPAAPASGNPDENAP